MLQYSMKMTPLKDTPRDMVVLQAGGTDMLKITPKGFYVRGVKIPQDDKEAESVYNAFQQWLSWAQLMQRDQ